jgi:membrane protein YdbS with pleckstrin-like domain
MFCPRCQTSLPEGSAFCNKCGASTAGGPPAPAPAPTPLGAAPAGPQEPEEELWKGRFSGKAKAHLWILWGLLSAGLLSLWFRVLTPDQRAYPATKWVFVGVAVVPFLHILWSIVVLKSGVRYRLTNYRLLRETGLLSRDINEIELLRVDDVSVHQNLLQRIFNVGTITVIAPSDQLYPSLKIIGIKNPIEVKELIRTHMRRRRAGSLNVEQL